MDEMLTIIERTAFLKGTEIFASIPTEVLAQLAGRGREIHFGAGETIFREGDPNSGAYMVVEGLVEIRKGRALDGVRTPGEGFGELSLMEGEPHNFTAVASEHTHVLNVSNEVLFDTILDYPEVGVGMVRSMGKRVTELVQRVHDLEGQIAHLAATLRSSGVEAPTYVSGAYRRPTS
ncbi:MAG: cyclic nucleotide-binding domain-containing protein [Candidatus Eisenbacteria bacterium]|uniref:Cyclic nucleotide-binding domain-containing protein n=1 Tax=Eiseniibacteriota bacterium TaxID=2212470 RepID=A0A538U610_UNCEI|nr:MAG: cyclic nucleotide-binding domain-containing protein [Candidatus Eisenbacteria bacterium]